MKITLKCSKTRLSDEEIDPLDWDDASALNDIVDTGWVAWDLDDLIDIERIIEERMPTKPKQIIEAFLMGLTYTDLDVSEKYWRYHYNKAVEFIKEELKL
jgi:hypothetical protein